MHCSASRDLLRMGHTRNMAGVQGFQGRGVMVLGY